MNDTTLDLNVVNAAHEALTKGDGKLFLAALLTATVYVLRTHLLAKVPESWGRVGAALRWLGSTDRGGVVSSVLIAGLGATATALEAGKVTWAAALNTFVVAAMASGLSTWQKKLKPAATPLPRSTVDVEPTAPRSTVDVVDPATLPRSTVDVEPAAPRVEPAATPLSQPAEPVSAQVVEIVSDEPAAPEVVVEAPVEKKPKKRAAKPRPAPRKKKVVP